MGIKNLIKVQNLGKTNPYFNRITMSETDSGGVPKEAGDSSDLGSSFVTKINVTSEGAANGHVTGKVNGEVIVNGHSDSSNEANDNKEEPSTENVKVEEINQNGSVLAEKVESVSMETDENNTSKNGTDEEIRTKEDVTTEEPKTNDNETCEKTAAETNSNDNKTTEKLNTNENLVTEEDKTNTLQEIDLENKNENKNVEEIVSEAKTVEITKTVQEKKELVGNDVVMQEEIYAPKPTILSVEAVKRDGLWKKWTYKQYYADVCAAAKSFIKRSVWPNLPCLKAVVQYTGEVAERKDNIYSVGILSEWDNVYSCQRSVWPNLPCLKAVVQYTGEVAEKGKDIVYILYIVGVNCHSKKGCILERSDVNVCRYIVKSAMSKGCSTIHRRGGERKDNVYSVGILSDVSVAKSAMSKGCSTIHRRGGREKG
ncbi:unnamed protein product [Mytilus coruscus]|uniref:Uncharacterized protein n=1 Tax=Mytilus coruscus TaxID=42192 RepID=A0A6J8BA89_MYTCO|nr:unnamed protein product [Mytilus coruscus]